MPRKSLAILGVAAATTALLTTESAGAGGSDLAGRWTATGISSKWVEGEWGDHCGAKPTTGGGSGSVVISAEGSELRISGGGRSYSTAQCWTTEPGMSVTAHTAGARSWKTVCQTGGGAARKVTIATTLNAAADTITFYETGQYQFMAGGRPCTASVGRYRTYKLAQRAESPETKTADERSAAGPEEAQSSRPAADRCAAPGPAKRVELSPGRRLMSAGDHFTFTARAFDAQGCRVRQRPKWTTEGGSGVVSVGPDGEVTIAEGAGELEADVRASFGGVSSTARVEVASKERFEALLAQGSDSTAPVPSATDAVASRSLGTEKAVAEDRASGRKLLFLGLLGIVAVALGLAGFLMMRRAKKQAADAALRRTGPESGVSSARRPPAAEAPRSLPPQDDPKKVCPVCGRQYPERSQFCGQDGTTLIPLN